MFVKAFVQGVVLAFLLDSYRPRYPLHDVVEACEACLIRRPRSLLLIDKERNA